MKVMERAQCGDGIREMGDDNKERKEEEDMREILRRKGKLQM